MARHFYVALIYANYDEAVRTIEMVSEYRDLERAELGLRKLNRAGKLAEHSSLIVTAGGTWDEAERELKARLGD